MQWAAQGGGEVRVLGIVEEMPECGTQCQCLVDRVVIKVGSMISEVFLNPSDSVIGCVIIDALSHLQHTWTSFSAEITVLQLLKGTEQDGEIQLDSLQVPAPPSLPTQPR